MRLAFVCYCSFKNCMISLFEIKLIREENNGNQQSIVNNVHCMSYVIEREY